MSIAIFYSSKDKLHVLICKSKRVLFYFVTLHNEGRLIFIPHFGVNINITTHDIIYRSRLLNESEVCHSSYMKLAKSD